MPPSSQKAQRGPIPHHVAVVLDGNGRWAESRGKSPGFGHKEGLKRAEELIHLALAEGVRHLSLFVFSKENWRRPQSEVSSIFSLFKEACTHVFTGPKAVPGVRVRMIGDFQALPGVLRQLIQSYNGWMSGVNEKMTLWVAFNYSGLWDIAQAARKIQQEALSAQGPGPEDPEALVPWFQGHLQTAEMPPVDLLLRTGGEQRVSNFLMWQLAYSELYFSKVLWPDFSKEAWNEAIDFFKQRQRRFGGRESE